MTRRLFIISQLLEDFRPQIEADRMNLREGFEVAESGTTIRHGEHRERLLAALERLAAEHKRYRMWVSRLRKTPRRTLNYRRTADKAARSRIAMSHVIWTMRPTDGLLNRWMDELKVSGTPPRRRSPTSPSAPPCARPPSRTPTFRRRAGPKSAETF